MDYLNVLESLIRFFYLKCLLHIVYLEQLSLMGLKKQILAYVCNQSSIYPI